MRGRRHGDGNSKENMTYILWANTWRKMEGVKVDIFFGSANERCLVCAPHQPIYGA